MITSSLYAGSLGGAQPAPNMTIQPYTGGLAAPAPQPAPQPAQAPAPWSWYDPSKVAAAQAMQAPGGDGRNILSGQALESILNPISGITKTSGTLDMSALTGANTLDSGMGSGQQITTGNQYTMKGGQNFLQISPEEAKQMGLNADNTIVGQYNNLGGNAGKDMARAYYTLDANGNATPIAAKNNYTPSAWVGGERDWVRDMAILAGAGYGAAAYAGAGATTAGVGEAGATTAGAGTSLGGEAASSLGGGYDFGAGFGGVGFGDAGGATLAGSDALGSGIAGSGASGIDAAYTGLGSAAASGGGAASNSLGSTLKDVVKSATSGAKGSQTGGNLMGVLGMGGSGLTAGDRYRQQLLAQSLRDNVQTPAQTLPGWIPGAS